MHLDLLAAVLAAPDDDGPRLVYADWLDENGEPERAEFIRVQIEIARRNVRAAVHPSTSELPLLSRERVLLHQHGERWLAPFRKRGEPLQNRGTHGQFVRGFVEVVWMPSSIFLKYGEKLLRQTPLRELRLTKANAREIEELFAFEATSRLITLDLSNLRIDDRSAIQLAQNPSFANIRRIRLRGSLLTDEGAIAIARSSNQWSLEELDMLGQVFISVSARDQLRNRYGNAVRFSTLDRPAV